MEDAASKGTQRENHFSFVFTGFKWKFCLILPSLPIIEIFLLKSTNKPVLSQTALKAFMKHRRVSWKHFSTKTFWLSSMWVKIELGSEGQSNSRSTFTVPKVCVMTNKKVFVKIWAGEWLPVWKWPSKTYFLY